MNEITSILRKPRIAMIVAGDKFGGAERQLLTLCKAGADRFDSVIFQTLSGPLNKAADRAGFRCRRVLEDKGLVESGRLLARLLKEEKIDVIHTHGYRSATVAALAIAMGSRLPVVRTLHGAPEIFKNVKMGAYETIGRVAGLYSRATTVYVSHELVKKMGASVRRSKVIYNGIDTDIVVGARPVGFGSRVNLAVVGRLEPVKGLPLLIEALTHPTLCDRVNLHIVGEGPQTKELIDLVKKLKLEKTVLFHGFQSASTDYIAHADFLLLPSLHEGVPYVLLEALALRTPVIASAVGGIPEVVRHNKEAVLISPSSSADITRALRRLIPDTRLCEELKNAGFHRVCGAFGAAQMARLYADLYHSKLS